MPGRPAISATSTASKGPRHPRARRSRRVSCVIAALIARTGKLQPSARGSMDPDFSVVIPVFNQEGAAAALAREIAAAFAGLSHEIIFVDDASRDGTRAALVALTGEIAELRLIGHARNA